MFCDIPAPHGRLEGLLWQVEGPAALAVVCHPHPQFGGTMHSHVPYRVATALRDLGVTTLRFNFRGVGRSTGTYSEGVGERDDVRTAMDYLDSAARTEPRLPLLVAGFSFGSWVGLDVGLSDPRATALLGVGLPVDIEPFTYLQACTKPLAVIQAERDEYGSPTEVRALLAQTPGLIEVRVVPGVGHLFEGALDLLSAAVTDLAPRLVPTLPTR